MTKILNYGWLGILAAGETVQLSRKDLLAAPREYDTTPRVLHEKTKASPASTSVTCQLAHVDLMGLLPYSYIAWRIVPLALHVTSQCQPPLHNTLNIHPQ